MAPVAATAGGYFTNGVPGAGSSSYPGGIPLTGAEALPADTNLPANANPISEGISVPQLAAAAGQRNWLDNGAMAVNQQGSSVIVAGGSGIGPREFAADRWFCDQNDPAGEGRCQITTAAPRGFLQSVKLWRNSGASAQQICMMQEIESSKAVGLQGRNVVLSLWGTAPSGSQSVAGYVISGTGVDEGLAALTATPAVTPAWTGLHVNGMAAWGLTTGWNRNWSPPIAIPANATEIGVEICFIPVGANPVEITGIQLEATLASTSGGQPPGPSAFDMRSQQSELLEAQRFFWQLNEPLSGVPVAGACEATAGSTNLCVLPLQVLMRGSTPTLSVVAAGDFQVNVAGAPTTLVPTAGPCSTTACQVNGTNTDTAGHLQLLSGGPGGGGIWTVSSDKVM